jgi:uncharacterized protein (DUF488 family)
VSQSELKRVVNEKTPHYVKFFRVLLLKIYGAKVGKIVEKEHQVDIVPHPLEERG